MYMSPSTCCGDGWVSCATRNFLDGGKVSKTQRAIYGEVSFETRDNEIKRAIL